MAYLFKKNDPKAIRAWTFYDWANSVYNLIISTAIFPIFYEKVTQTRDDQGFVVSDMVTFFGREFVNTELYSYVYSASFFVVVLLVPILSGIADFSGTKKRFLQFFCYLGAASCMSLYFFDVERLEISMLSVFLASIGFWGSLVFYNSFLLEIADKDQHDRISAKGFSLGYIGSVLLLVTILILSQFLEVMPIKFGFLLVGVWWVGFAQYTYYYLPGKDYYTSREKDEKFNIIWYGYRELRKVWGELKQHARVKWFLASYFTYNMGVQTIMLLAVLFASKEIDWVVGAEWWQSKETGLIVSIILIQLIAIIGAQVMSRLSNKLGNVRTLMFATIIWIACTIYAYFIHMPLEFYTLATFVGFVMGGIQSLSRSTYSKMLPPTEDNASYFSFFDVMEKVGLIFGPLLFGMLEGIYGDMRKSVLMLMVFFIVGFLLLWKTLYVEKKSDVEAV